MDKYDPFIDEATTEELIPPTDAVPLSPTEMDTALQGIISEHKARCSGTLTGVTHLDGAAWFAWRYRCVACGTQVYVQQARKRGQKWWKWNLITTARPTTNE